MRRWTTAIPPALLGTAWLLCLFAPLLSPGRALGNRDIAAFHLPLRASFRELAEFGVPVWNPWVHGGQPLLSNPSYGAFYPPSWLIFAVTPSYALSLMAILHAVLAFAGAWRLARHFGGNRGAAALAGVGYVGCGAYLSLLSAYTLFGSMAWFPWVLVWADKSLRMPEGEPWWRPGLLAGTALGLQLLNGEPSTVVMSGLALLALAASRRRLATAPRVLLPFLFAVTLAAVQLLPTLGHLADSPRRNLSALIATQWSMPAERLVEIIFPRFFGDPKRALEGLFFGWSLNDRNYPYVESLYPGLLLAILGASALLLWRIPRRAALSLALAGGCFLALGRHNPLYGWLRETVPVLSVLRYPEKFIILSVMALVVAGVLGWQRLLDERESGRPESADFPLAIALIVLATALILSVQLFWAPRIALWFIASHGSPFLPATRRGVALAYLQGESLATIATAASVAALLLLCRWRRPPRRLLEALAVFLLATDLWRHGHNLPQTLPAEAYRTPPALAATILPVRDRVFVQEAWSKVPLLFRKRGGLLDLHTRPLATLDPYSGLLWHIPYAFDTDFDNMLTGWGRKANDILRSEAARPQMMYRYLGVWNVGTVLIQKTFKEQVAALQDPAAMPLRKITNTYVLPRFRFAPRVTFHSDHAAALAAARAQGWTVARNEHCVRTGRLPETTLSYRRPPRLLGITDQGGRIEVRYRAEEGAFFIAAMTYDRKWQAVVDGRPLPAHPTAACQLGVKLPAGEHQLVLEFREPALGLGAVISLLALGAGTAAFFGLRPRRRIA